MIVQPKLFPKAPQLQGIRFDLYFLRFRAEQAQLQHGDLLHLSFTSGQSGSVHNAEFAGKMLQEKYPDKKIVVIDTLCSSSGYGLLVDYAADMRDAGETLEDTAAWVTAHRQRIHHQFFSTDLSFYRRSGRMSGAAATLGAILGICPIMRLNDAGRIIAYDKVRGKKKAVAETTRIMLEHAENGAAYDGKCYICNSNCRADAEALRASLEKAFPALKDKIVITNIGTIIASHCGPGTVAVFFVGDERQPG